jgi:hypothetical protein
MPGRISPRAASADQLEREQPPVIPVSSQPIVCVEHPCIIKNLDRGISSLGGDYAINKVRLYCDRPSQAFLMPHSFSKGEKAQTHLKHHSVLMM